MTQVDQDAILGRTIRAHKEARNKFGALESLNREIADSARKLAHAIERYPDRIHVSKGRPEGMLAVADALYVYRAEEANRLNPDILREHLAEYVSVKNQKADLRQQIINQGADDPGE